MRLIATFKSPEEGRNFYVLLTKHKIKCHLDTSNSDYEVWVKEEDKLSKAQELYQLFISGKLKSEPEVANEPDQMPQPPVDVEENVSQIAFKAPLTRLCILICTVFFIISMYQTWEISKKYEGKVPVFAQLTPIQKVLIYDLPVSLSLVKEYSEKSPKSSEGQENIVSPAQKTLLHEIEQNRPWTGFYNVLSNWKNHQELLGAKKFTDIKKGEVWRLITPIFLHSNLLHLLFNMLWLYLLGKMIEENIRAFRYLVFIAFVAILTNTLQYLMTGPFFMGISGVVAAMSGYIWVRKRAAPWELYPIGQGVIGFLWIFIFGMLALQMIVFFLNILHIITLDMRIANTAHVSGVLIGLGLAKIKFFQRKI